VNQEVEEQIAIGRKTLAQRRGATDGELTYAALDVNIGMLVSNVVMYFIILSTGATLFKSGSTHIQSATDAAAALRPLAGRGAEALLAIGLIGAGFWQYRSSPVPALMLSLRRSAGSTV
jgi:Mn2+/Fe2+ NRAMP family transporter